MHIWGIGIFLSKNSSCGTNLLAEFLLFKFEIPYICPPKRKLHMRFMLREIPRKKQLKIN